MPINPISSAGPFKTEIPGNNWGLVMIVFFLALWCWVLIWHHKVLFLQIRTIPALILGYPVSNKPDPINQLNNRSPRVFYSEAGKQENGLHSRNTVGDPGNPFSGHQSPCKLCARWTYRAEHINTAFLRNGYLDGGWGEPGGRPQPEREEEILQGPPARRGDHRRRGSQILKEAPQGEKTNTRRVVSWVMVIRLYLSFTLSFFLPPQKKGVGWVCSEQRVSQEEKEASWWLSLQRWVRGWALAKNDLNNNNNNSSDRVLATLVLGPLITTTQVLPCASFAYHHNLKEADKV